MIALFVILAQGSLALKFINVTLNWNRTQVYWLNGREPSIISRKRPMENKGYFRIAYAPMLLKEENTWSRNESSDKLDIDFKDILKSPFLTPSHTCTLRCSALWQLVCREVRFNRSWLELHGKIVLKILVYSSVQVNLSSKHLCTVSSFLYFCGIQLGM